jgi:hypothetical protein
VFIVFGSAAAAASSSLNRYLEGRFVNCLPESDRDHVVELLDVEAVVEPPLLGEHGVDGVAERNVSEHLPGLVEDKLVAVVVELENGLLRPEHTEALRQRPLPERL